MANRFAICMLEMCQRASPEIAEYRVFRVGLVVVVGLGFSLETAPCLDLSCISEWSEFGVSDGMQFRGSEDG